MRLQSIALALALGCADGFLTVAPEHRLSTTTFKNTIVPNSLDVAPLFASRQGPQINPTKRALFRRVLDRFDTIEAAGLEDVKVAGVVDRIKSLHNPKTYLLLSLLAGWRWQWCFRSPLYWFGVAFCIKWYRARYVFKIPVWDRQPNWNNIITSKDQEKDLKAFTCKKCGSTLFIAKTREFFFEGDTGIGGLGCFSCGAKGRENFVMDRDRIVEDVADMDDYFEYERPLDFVSRAERRKLMKEAGGNKNKANEILLARSTGQAAATRQSSEPNVNNGAAEVGEVSIDSKDDVKPLEPSADTANKEDGDSSSATISAESGSETAKPKPKKSKKSKKPSAPVVEEDLDILDKDGF